MPSLLKNCLLLLTLVLTAILSTAAANPVQGRYATLQLLSEQSSLPLRGGEITLGFRLISEPGWQPFWQNPGEAGSAVSISWTLPEGAVASALKYPAPERVLFDGFTTYRLPQDSLLISRLTVPDLSAFGDAVTLTADVSWAACNADGCASEQATVSIRLPIGKGDIDRESSLVFDTARALWPLNAEWPSAVEFVDDNTRLFIAPEFDVSRIRDIHLFAGDRQLMSPNNQTVKNDGMSLLIEGQAGRHASTLTDPFFVLQYKDQAGGLRNVALSPAISDGSQSLAIVAAVSTQEAPADLERFSLRLLLAALFGAFLGGIILNLMPCVFPILSMKALHLVSIAQGDRRMARQGGIYYTLGVVVAFAIFGIILLSIKAAGSAISWGFQMQSPVFNLSLGLLMVAISLNLFGIYEISGKFVGVGQSLTERGERRAAFFTGLLVVIVATPCTAPFMAAALGWAFAQPGSVTMATMLMLGLGLAFPFLLLSFLPALGRIMPKPGEWMVAFKQFLGFPMMMTALWLFWLVGQILGTNAMALAALAGLMLGFTLWAFGRLHCTNQKSIWIAMMILGVGSMLYIISNLASSPPAITTEKGVSAGRLGGLELERFDPDRLLAYLDADQPLFVYFTADWCVSCKVNERMALSTDDVAAAFAELNIKVMEGDWTRADPTITEWLSKYGRAGVPLYLYFPAGSTEDSARVLPQILLPATVIEAIS